MGSIHIQLRKGILYFYVRNFGTHCSFYSVARFLSQKSPQSFWDTYPPPESGRGKTGGGTSSSSGLGEIALGERGDEVHVRKEVHR